MSRKLGGTILHPFFFASYPVLALLATNASQMRPIVGFRPLLLSLMAAMLLLIAFRLLFRSGHRAALATTFLLVLLFSYGHVYDALKAALPSMAALVRHRHLLPAVAAATLLAGYFIAIARAPERATPILNLVAAVAIAFPLVRLVSAEAAYLRSRDPRAQVLAECTLTPAPDAPLPDIYLIIMDAYERDDVLREMHGFDNSPFLHDLEARGFYVARGSLSNYRHTELSLASLLNLDYIQSFKDVYSPERISTWGIIQKITRNRLRQELECLGYHSVAFETGAFWTEWRDADYFYEMDAGPFADLGLMGAASRFEARLLDTTLARAGLDAVRQSQASSQASVIDPLAEHRQRILFAFDQLNHVASLPSPKLVFVHILSPHPPMVFGPNGEFVNYGEFETTMAAGAGEVDILGAYSDQVQYLNTRLLQAVDAILAQSEVSPVIVIQGDHGWADRDHEDKLSILNAYHLPGGDTGSLYPTITPVNSYRLILDDYFGGNFGLLQDISYFSHEIDIFKFELVPNTWSAADP